MPGSGSDASGSATTAAPVTGVGLNDGLPLFWTPPCTSITDALIEGAPLADRADDELEST